MRCVLAVIAGFALNLAFSTDAHADELYKFAQITCANDLHYFAIRIVPIYNLPPHGRYLDKGLSASVASIRRQEVREHLYDADSLMRRTLRCRIPAAMLERGWDNARPAINVDVIGRSVGKVDKQWRILVDDNFVRIVVNGQPIGILELGNGSSGSNVSSIEIEFDGVELVQRICRVDRGGEVPLSGTTDVVRCITSPFQKRR